MSEPVAAPATGPEETVMPDPETATPEQMEKAPVPAPATSSGYQPRHAVEAEGVDGIEPPAPGTAHETIPAWQGVIKAIVGALVAFLGALGTALSDGKGFADLTAFQWITATTAALVALGGVYALPNRDPKAGPQG